MGRRTVLQLVQKYHPEVTKVVEAKKPLTIEVTPQDAKYSRSRSVDSCALAKACNRSFDGAMISMSIAYMIKGKKAIRYVVPQAISRELVSFDRSHVFAPGQYTLNAPSKWQKSGKGHATERRADRYLDKDGKPYAKGLKAYKHHKTAGIRAL